jgi:hypothetical protein
MSLGLRGLVAAASETALPYTVQMYCGNMLITGRPAPPSWFHEVSKRAFAAEMQQYLGRQLKKEEGRARLQQATSEFDSIFDRARATESSPPDELTLADATVFPAIQTQGTRSGGQQLPVLRVPLASIDAWWVVNGEAIRGSGGGGMGFGFLFPIGS